MFQKIILKNKLRLVLAPIQNTETITVLVIVGTGSRFEKKELNGISHFLEHMFFKGTKKRPTALKVSTELDKIGASYNAFTGKEITGFYIKSSSSYLDLSLDVISDILINSKFDSEEINRERGVILEEMKMIQDTPMHYISDLFESLLYGKSAMGQLIIGTKERVSNFQRSDFLNYFQDHYTPENTVVCLAGDSKKIKTSETKVRKYFKEMNKNIVQPKESKDSFLKQIQPQILLHTKKTDQAHLCLGVRGYGLKDQERFALKLLAVILGGNMSSRLFIEVREKRGFAYYIRTTHEAYSDRGYLVTQAGVHKDKIEESIKIILKEYKKIAEEGVSFEDLQRAKDYIKGISSISLETSDQIANFLANQEILLGNISTLKQHFRKIDKVSVIDIKNIARDIFVDSKLNLAVIGSYKNKKIFEKILKF